LAFIIETEDRVYCNSNNNIYFWENFMDKVVETEDNI